MSFEVLVPYIIIITFPILVYIAFRLIRKSKKLVFLLDDKLLKSPIKLSSVLLITAISYILYSILIHIIFNSEGAQDYVWNLVGLLLSASHLAKTKGAPYNYTVLYVFTMFFGLFVYGIFISNLVGYVKEKLKKIAKGRTQVIVENHVLFIGKSKYLYPVIDQYIEAAMISNNRNQLKQKIVVLTSDTPEKIMTSIEQETSVLMKNSFTALERKTYKKLLQSKLIYRTGSTDSINDLELCNIHKAECVILLGKDSEKIKSLLAINATDFKDNNRSFVISKFDDAEMLDIAERNDFTDDYDLINISHLISSLTAQTTIQPNLSNVYNSLLDFSKCSIEFLALKGNLEYEHMIGKDFNYASNYLSNVAVLGIKNDSITVNPNADKKVILTEKDSLIIIKKPFAPIKVDASFGNHIDDVNINMEKITFIKEELNLVIIGYGSNTQKLLEEFDNIISSTSHVTILCNDKYKKHINPKKILKDSNVEYEIEMDSYTTFDDFKSKISVLDEGNDIDSIIVLPNKFIEKSIRDDDSIFTLMDLKHLERENNRDYNITIDLSDINSHNLIENLDVADVIISDKLSSELIYQFAVHRDVKVVYEELLSIEGDEIYFNPITSYVKDLSKPINFYTLSEAALQKDEIAIGYKNSDGVNIISTDKSDLIQYKEGDFIIVVSSGH